MKYLLIALLLTFSAGPVFTQVKPSGKLPDSTKEMLLVEAACGQCQFGMPGNSCDLAVRIDGKSYFVDGTAIDEHGDAHAKDGFCNAVRKANVQGQIINNRFQVSYFRLTNNPPTKEKRFNLPSH